MQIASVEWSGEVKSLLKEIFTREGFPKFFQGNTDDYILHLLEHVARKLAADARGEFHEEMRRLAIDAYNRIDYGIKLSERSYRDDD